MNNNKEWMDANRASYLAAKGDFEALVTGIIQHLDKVGMDPESMSAKASIFRMNRDVRFSANKDPYKTNFGAAFSKGGKKSPEAGYYFHLQPGNSFIAAGMWMPDAPVLQKVRQEIDYNLKEFETILSNKKFAAVCGTIDGERLKNPPKGYLADNPAIEYLKFKTFTISTPLLDEAILHKDLTKQIIGNFQIMQPFVDFLNRALD